MTSPKERPMMSVALAAVKDTIMRMLREGKACANDGSANGVVPAARMALRVSRRLKLMLVSMC